MASLTVNYYGVKHNVYRYLFVESCRRVEGVLRDNKEDSVSVKYGLYCLLLHIDLDIINILISY